MISSNDMDELIAKLPKNPTDELIQSLVEQNIQLETENERLKKNLEDLDHESRRFRAGIANSKIDCVYCGLSKDDMAKCASGFPGCGRADDITNDPDWNPIYDTEIAIDGNDEINFE